MCRKIRCDRESERFCKICWELNKPLNGGVEQEHCSSATSHDSMRSGQAVGELGVRRGAVPPGEGGAAARHLNIRVGKVKNL